MQGAHSSTVFECWRRIHRGPGDLRRTASRRVPIAPNFKAFITPGRPLPRPVRRPPLRPPSVRWLSIAGAFTTAMTLAGTAQAGGLTVLDAFPAGTAVVTCPDEPDPALEFYPPRARTTGTAGEATIACEVSDLNRVTRCTWTSETPANLGFGEAAAKVGCRFRPYSSTANGTPLAGKIFSTTVKFQPPP